MENGRSREVIILMWNGRMEVAINGAKCALTLHTCIFVTDRVKTNEQNKRLGICSDHVT